MNNCIIAATSTTAIGRVMRYTSWYCITQRDVKCLFLPPQAMPYGVKSAKPKGIVIPN